MNKVIILVPKGRILNELNPILKKLVLFQKMIFLVVIHES